MIQLTADKLIGGVYFLSKKGDFHEANLYYSAVNNDQFFLWSPLPASQDKAEHLFFIERNKNRNIVQYDVRLTGNRE